MASWWLKGEVGCKRRTRRNGGAPAHVEHRGHIVHHAVERPLDDAARSCRGRETLPQVEDLLLEVVRGKELAGGEAAGVEQVTAFPQRPHPAPVRVGDGGALGYGPGRFPAAPAARSEVRPHEPGGGQRGCPDDEPDREGGVDH